MKQNEPAASECKHPRMIEAGQRNNANAWCPDCGWFPEPADPAKLPDEIEAALSELCQNEYEMGLRGEVSPTNANHAARAVLLAAVLKYGQQQYEEGINEYIHDFSN